MRNECKELKRLQDIEMRTPINYDDPDFDAEHATHDEEREVMTEETRELLDRASHEITKHLCECSLCAKLSPEAVIHAKKRRLEK